MTAPVCNIPGTTPLSQGRQPNAKLTQSIPLAVDLQSALAAINAMRLILYSMLGANTQGGANLPVSLPTTLTRGAVGAGPKLDGGGTTTGSVTGSSRTKAPEARYAEVNRVEESVRIFDPNGTGAYVDFRRINRVDMRDNVTGEMWTWNRNHG